MSASRGMTRLITELATAIWRILPRRGRWLAGIALAIWLAWGFLIQEQHGGASVIVMSVSERPISYASANGNMGGNTLAFDGLNAGGKTAGPYRIEGNTVKIGWELDMTEEQAKAGYQFEKHAVTLPMPQRDKAQDEFCILFLPDNQPVVRWAKSCFLEMNETIEPYRTRRRR